MSQFIIKEPSTMDNLLAELKQLSPLKIWDVTIKEYKKNKTGQQRRYFHKILQTISDYSGDEVSDLKMKIKYRVLPLKEINVEGTRHLYPISSEDASIAQYNDLIEAALMMAEALQVSMRPASYYGLQWRET